MANIYDVANFFIDVAVRGKDDFITNLKLNKLLYYAQGSYLARTGRSLFTDEIEAWPLGPVVPTVYQKYKVCGSSPIQSVDEDYSFAKFTPDEKAALIDVMCEFGRFTGSELVSLTHRPGTPWSDTKESGKNVIDNELIKAYFTANPVPTTDEALSHIPVVEKLPADWYDPEEDKIWEAYK